MCTTNFYKETVFLTGLILNIISSAIIIVLIILCGVQYKYININWGKINSFQNLCDYELSLCIIYIFCCVLGFIVFIKSLECKTMQKIYIIYGILAWVYSIVVCVICFISYPNKIKNNSDKSCEMLNFKGILKDFNKFENIFYEVNKYLCSNDCPCRDGEKMNFQKCNFNGNFSNYVDKDYNLNDKKFMSYWSLIEDKFKCFSICEKFSNLSDENNDEEYKFLFTDNTKTIEKYGCIYPLSNWLNQMIISFNSLVIINIVLSILCIYICFAILYDKVYEGSNLPQSINNNIYGSGYISKNGNRQTGIIRGIPQKDNSLDVKVNTDNKK